MTARIPLVPCDHPCAGLCRPAGLAAAHRAHRSRLLTRARAVLGDRESAEDVVQEVFLRAWAACASFDPSAGPTLLAWLCAITRNVAVDQVRSRAARPPRHHPGAAPAEQEAGHPPVTVLPATVPTDTALLRLLLVDALAAVSPEHRAVVVHTVLRDRSYRDVAAELDLPVGTVRSRAFYALRRLRSSLDRTDLAA